MPLKPEGLDVVGRTESVQVRLKRYGERFTQEVTVPGKRATLLCGEGKDLHVHVDGDDSWLAYEHVGVVRRPEGSFCLQAGVERPGYTITTTFKLATDRGVLDVGTTFEAHRPLVVAAVENTYRFSPAGQNPREVFRPDYAWLPNLKYGADGVAGQHAFRSPCAIVQFGDEMAAIVPSLSAFAGHFGLPAALDFECPGFLRYGLVTHCPDGLGLFHRRPDRGVSLKPGDRAAYAFSVMIRNGLTAQMGHREVVRFLWSRFAPMPGMPDSKEEEERSLRNLPESARQAFAALFGPLKAWRGVHLESGDGGGFVAELDHWDLVPPDKTDRPAGLGRLGTGLTRKLPLVPKVGLLANWFSGVLPPVLFQGAVNDVRTAVGMALFGRRWGDASLSEAARKILALALSAPAQNGLIPAIYAGSDRHPVWVNDPAAGKVQNRFRLCDAAETGLWLLEYQNVDPHTPIIDTCRSLAGALMRYQTLAGGLPAVVESERRRPVGDVTADLNTTAAVGRFLAALYEHDRESACLEGARKCASFVTGHGFSLRRWQDEVLPPEWRAAGPDPMTGLSPQSNLCIFRSSDLLRRLAVLTGEERYREYGKAVLDDLLLYQQLWDAPFLSVGTAGGFGASNVEPVWNEARGGLFATLLLDWYDLTGEREYFQRGVAALQACFALASTPGGDSLIHIPGAPEYGGMIPAGYGYGGKDGPMPSRIQPGWGAGTACTAAALAHERYGDVFIDVPRRQAFGVSDCRVADAAFSPTRIDLRFAPGRRDYAEQTRALLLKFRVDPHAECDLLVNGEDMGRFSGVELGRGVEWNPGRFPAAQR